MRGFLFLANKSLILILAHNTMHFHIITLFPEMFDSYIHGSIIGRAVTNKKIRVSFYNPRDFTKDKWKRVDQKPYGGGPGMVMEPVSVVKAIDKALSRARDRKKVKIIFFSAGGKKFTGTHAARYAKKYDHIILISGRYEGVDARVRKIFKAEEISVGDYILTGGEIPALILIDSISRHIPNVLGNSDSLEESRTASSDVYTRPETFTYKGKKYSVPKVLLSGHHKNIEEWKKKRSRS